MFKRISTYIKCKIIDLSLQSKRCKAILIIVGICAVIGIISAFTSLDKTATGKSNVIVLLKNGDMNILSFYLKFIIFTLLIYAVGFLLTFNFYAFLGNAVVIMFAVKFFVNNALCSCVIDGFTGYVVLIIMWTPLLFFNLISFALYLCRLYDVIGFTCNKKLIVPYSSYWRSTKKILLNFSFTALTVNLMFSGILLIIFGILT